MADATLIFDTKVDEKGFEKGADSLDSAIRELRGSINELSANIKKCFDDSSIERNAKSFEKGTEAAQKQEGAINKLGDALDKAMEDSLAERVVNEFKDIGAGIGDASSRIMSLQEQIRKARLELDTAKQKLESFVEKQIPTNEYTEIQNQIDKTTAKLQQLEERKEKFLSTGGKESSSTYQKIQYDIEECKNTINAAQGEMQDLVDKGKAFTLGSENAQEMSRLSGNVTSASNRLSILNQKLSEASSKESKIGEQSGKVSRLSSAFSAVCSKIKDYISKLAEARRAEDKSAKSSGNFSNSLHSGIKSMLKYTLSIRSAYMAVRKLKAAFKEGLNNLVQYDSTTNKSMSSLMSSLTQLKNSLATAFAPILNVVAPILSKLISYLSEAANSVGRFFAALTGQKNVVVATKVNQDYAKSLDKTKKSTDKASKSLASFDELNVIKNDSNDKDSSELSSSDMFKTENVESRYKDMASRVKAVFAELFKPMKNSWNKYGKGLIESIKKAFTGISSVIMSIGKSFKEVWLNGTGERICDHILQILTNIFSTIGNIGLRFSEAWDKNGVGTAIVQALADIFDGILEDINSMAVATNEWSETLDFSPLLESIKGLLESIKPLTDDIGDGLVFLYKNALLPLASFSITKLIPKFLDALAGAINVVDSAIEACKPGFKYLWDKVLVPIAEWTGGAITEILGALKNAFSDVSDSIGKHKNAISKALELMGKAFEWMWMKTKPVLNILKEAVKSVVKLIGKWFGDLMDVFDGVVEFLEGVFSGDWKKALRGLLKIFAGMANGIMSGLETAVNFAISAINSLSFDVPEWVPGIGGEHFGFNLSEVELKRFNIPPLAKGAVIPPRAPFLAMLGDQNRGTNIEAPLDTIKQAVRDVLGEAGDNGSTEIVQVDVHIQQNDKGTFEIVKTEAAKYKKRTGKLAFQ